VLLEERSQAIERNLRGSKTRPERDPLCLRCHSTQGAVREAVDRDAARPTVTLLEGVGCDRCHSSGEGARWIGLHYSREWSRQTSAAKAATGFRPLAERVGQARLCAECHVGSGSASVDHDLIAAGHPPLRFEFSSFLATMPPHWKRKTAADAEVRTWAIGQVVSAEFALELLAARAEKGTRKPWPEFAEYDCFACHHPLHAASARPRQRVSGTLPWRRWYTAALQDALSMYDVPGREGVLKRVHGLEEAMARPEPDRAKIAREASALAAILRVQARTLASAPTPSPGRLRRGFAAMGGRPVHDWESATQRYLGLAALHQSLTDHDPDSADDRVMARLRGLAKQLRFSPGRDFPGDFDVDKFSEELKKLQRRAQGSVP
jgi:hypothetical protein